MLVCVHCYKDCKNENSKRNHERLCKSNPNKQFSNFEFYHKNGPEPWNKGKTGLQKAWNKGLPGTFKDKFHSEKTRQRMSKKKKELYLSGWEPICGRAKKYDYESPIAGKIKVDGTWELSVAKFLDSIGVDWNRNKKRFPYTKPDGKHSTYQPDFVINENKYIEVKGYETDLDKAKWSQFNEPLVIFRKEHIDEINGMAAEKVGCTGLLNQLRGKL